MLPPKIRNRFITIFVIFWLCLFHYESLRANYLNSLFVRDLPKFKFLFPPAGWIMFFRVDEVEGYTEVYAQKGDRLEKIDPHRIFENHWLGYDNIRRNILSTVSDPRIGNSFCHYLQRKFPGYDYFAVAQVVYSQKIQSPDHKLLRVLYRCEGTN